MPTATNITVKNASNTDVVFNVVTASGGDNSPAVFEAVAVSAVPLARPRFEITARPNNDKSARKVLTHLVVPYTSVDPVTGLTKVVGNVVFRNGELTRPRAIPDTFVADAVAYNAGLQASAVVKDSYASGYAPT